MALSFQYLDFLRTLQIVLPIWGQPEPLPQSNLTVLDGADTDIIEGPRTAHRATNDPDSTFTQNAGQVPGHGWLGHRCNKRSESGPTVFLSLVRGGERSNSDGSDPVSAFGVGEPVSGVEVVELAGPRVGDEVTEA